MTQSAIDTVLDTARKIGLPQNETEAEWMQKAGYQWIEKNAPHRLTEQARQTAQRMAALEACVRDLSNAVTLSQRKTAWYKHAEIIRSVQK